MYGQKSVKLEDKRTDAATSITSDLTKTQKARQSVLCGKNCIDQHERTQTNCNVEWNNQHWALIKKWGTESIKSIN